MIDDQYPTLADGFQTAFLGSANETREAWRMNYEIVWEDTSPEGVAWVQEEFDALWHHPMAAPLSEVIVQDIERISQRRVLFTVPAWQEQPPKTLRRTPRPRSSKRRSIAGPMACGPIKSISSSWPMRRTTGHGAKPDSSWRTRWAWARPCNWP